MMTNNARLRALVIETPIGNENEIQITHNGKLYKESDITWVFDYVGPTGRISKEGILRKPLAQDFQNIINGNLNCYVQIANDGDLILHYIEQPQ